MPINGVFRTIENGSGADLEKLQSALSYGSQNAQGTQLISDAALQHADLVINHSGINQTSVAPDGQITISWDPDTAIAVTDAAGNIRNYESPASNLFHEMSHAADTNFVTNANTADAQYDTVADRIAVERTNAVVVPLGEEGRTNHSGGLVQVNNPTEHTAGGKWVEIGSDGQEKSSTQPDGFNDDWNGADSDPEEPGGGGDAGGGGGGGGCVSIDAILPDGRLAGDIAVGDEMQLADQQTLEAGRGVVSYSQIKTAAGFRITTVSGVSLKCSDSAPIPTPEGLVLAPELLGKQVAVRQDGAQGSVRWEKVVAVDAIGEIQVQHITVGDKCFWAGEKPGAYILHHNLKDEGGDDPDPGDDDDYMVAQPNTAAVKPVIKAASTSESSHPSAEAGAQHHAPVEITLVGHHDVALHHVMIM
jgi:hypothetical protein